MRMPPDPNGHGGSQRAWHLVQALKPLGVIHFVLIYRDQDRDCVETSLDLLEPHVASITRIDIPEWRSTYGKQLKVLHPGLSDFLRMRSAEAPRLRRSVLARIAELLPDNQPDVIFAGRLCSAFILQSLFDRALLSSKLRIVDYDDIMSRFRWRQLANMGHLLGKQGRLSARIDAHVIARAERRVADSWHGVSVCTDEDVRDLKALKRRAAVAKVPNIVERPLLPPRPQDGRFNILFTGNLSFSPNSDGLCQFLEEAWPRITRAVAGAQLSVVGLNPSDALTALLKAQNIPLHANVPSLAPFYAECDAVISPTLVGSGTRIKILEAMAYGRAIVSTAIGAEGLHLEDGRHFLLAKNISDFGDALILLANDAGLRERLVHAARAHQQTHFGQPAMTAAIHHLFTAGEDRLQAV